MPNYSLTINSKFRPYSYQEYLAPVLAATQAHQAVEEQYANLATKADAWRDAAMRDPNSRAAQMYSNYQNDLQTRADDLAKNGLNSRSRSSMFDMHRRYNSEILPIEQAYTRQQAHIDEQRKLRASDSSIMFDRDASTSSLDDYLNDKNLTYTPYSGNALTKMVAASVDSLKNRLSEYGKAGNIDAFTGLFKKEYGASPQQVQKALAYLQNPGSVKLDDETSRILSNIVENAVESSGIKGWNSSEALDKAYYYAGLGLTNAIGKSDVSPYTDHAAVESFKSSLALRNAMAMSGSQTTQRLSTNPVGLYSARERTDIDTKTKKYNDYFTMVNGKYVLSDKGKQKYDSDKHFRSFVDTDLKGNPEAFGAYKTYSMYDTKRNTEFVYDPDDSQHKDWKRNLQRAAGKDGLYITEYDGESFKRTGKKLSIGDLFDDKTHILSINSSWLGDSSLNMTIERDGKKMRIELPKGINSTVESNIQSTLKYMNDAQTLINSGTDSLGRPIPEKQIEALIDKYSEGQENLYKYISQLVVSNSTDTQKFIPYGI